MSKKRRSDLPTDVACPVCKEKRLLNRVATVTDYVITKRKGDTTYRGWYCKNCDTEFIWLRGKLIVVPPIE